MRPDRFSPPTSIFISQQHYATMISHLQAVYPQEGCGILAGSANRVRRVYPVQNQLYSTTEFEMDPRQQLQVMLDLESHGWEMLAIFHSHPKGPQTPSPTDVAKAYYPDSAQLIVSLKDPATPKARAFTIVTNQVNEIPLLVE